MGQHFSMLYLHLASLFYTLSAMMISCAVLQVAKKTTLSLNAFECILDAVTMADCRVERARPHPHRGLLA